MRRKRPCSDLTFCKQKKPFDESHLKKCGGNCAVRMKVCCLNIGKKEPFIDEMVKTWEFTSENYKKFLDFIKYLATDFNLKNFSRKTESKLSSKRKFNNLLDSLKKCLNKKANIDWGIFQILDKNPQHSQSLSSPQLF